VRVALDQGLDILDFLGQALGADGEGGLELGGEKSDPEFLDHPSEFLDGPPLLGGWRRGSSSIMRRTMSSNGRLPGAS